MNKRNISMLLASALVLAAMVPALAIKPVAGSTKTAKVVTTKKKSSPAPKVKSSSAITIKSNQPKDAK